MKGPLARPVVPLAGLDACRPKVLSGFGITTCINIIVMRRFHSIQFGSRVQRAFGRPGSDLLSRVLRRSTISAGAFHGRVRNGIGCSRSAITTRSAKRTLFEKLFSVPSISAQSEGLSPEMGIRNENDQADRTISTGKLQALPLFHTRPINVVVFHGSQGILVLRWVSRLDAFSGYPVRI
jgi:hypothetical protein